MKNSNETRLRLIPHKNHKFLTDTHGHLVTSLQNLNSSRHDFSTMSLENWNHFVIILSKFRMLELSCRDMASQTTTFNMTNHTIQNLAAANHVLNYMIMTFDNKCGFILEFWIFKFKTSHERVGIRDRDNNYWKNYFAWLENDWSESVTNHYVKN